MLPREFIVRAILECLPVPAPHNRNTYFIRRVLEHDSESAIKRPVPPDFPIKQTHHVNRVASQVPGV
jgi:hypothetical protein